MSTEPDCPFEEAFPVHAVEALPVPAVIKEPRIVFQTPSQLVAYSPPEGIRLVGESHITKGATAVIAGAPGIGKSRVAVALAVAGARGVPWMNLKIHRTFRTLVIQNENGLARLKDEFTAIGADGLDEFIRVSPPPPFGFEFGTVDFNGAIKTITADFAPDLVIIDPWTATVTDDKGKDYRDTLKTLRHVFGSGDASPALLIVAHTRKPSGADGAPKGRDLMHEVSGSHVLTAHARCVFNMLAASNDPDDDRVIFVNSKNNDGPQPKPTAWHRQNGLFAPCTDFDWKTYHGQQQRGRAKVGLGDLREVFEQGGGTMTRQETMKALMESLGCSRSVAYDALKSDGPFSIHLKTEGATLRWIEPDDTDSESEHA